MKKTLWLFQIVLTVFLPQVLCKTYKTHIGLATLPKTRQYTHGVAGFVIRIVNRDGNFACGGAYIAPLVVVTSASCMYPYRHAVNDLIAEADIMLADEDNFSNIDTYYTPPEFENGKNYMDVAVLRLRNPIKGKRTEFIKLCETKITPQMEMKSYGWGYGSFTILQLSSDAIVKPVPSISMEQCNKGWSNGKDIVLSKSIFCVQFDTKDRTQCIYDPGSPLVYEDQFCGIVSEGSSCLHPKFPAIYTDVNKVRDFILLTMAQIQMGFRSADL